MKQDEAKEARGQGSHEARKQRRGHVHTLDQMALERYEAALSFSAEMLAALPARIRMDCGPFGAWGFGLSGSIFLLDLKQVEGTSFLSISFSSSSSCSSSS